MWEQNSKYKIMLCLSALHDENYFILQGIKFSFNKLGEFFFSLFLYSFHKKRFSYLIKMSIPTHLKKERDRKKNDFEKIKIQVRVL